MESSFCLFHDDKDGFTTMQKDLQKCGWIPRKYAHRLAMAVCACRINKLPMPSRDEFLDSRTKLQEELEPMRGHLPKNLLTCIEDSMKSATETDYSYCQFMTVLVKAKLGDFSMLSRAVLSTNSKVSEKDLQREINRKKKLTSHQIEMIINKKKKKMNSYVIKLPVFPGNFTKLKLEFVRESKGFVEPKHKENNANFEGKVMETYVTVWGSPENIKTLGQRLIEEARAVQKRMDDLRKERKSQKAARRVFSHLYDDELEDYEETVMLGHMKEHLTDDFSLKVQKSAKQKTKTVQVKTQTSVLDGGHCLQCFKPFTNLHKDSSSCTFHKGYAVVQDLSPKRVQDLSPKRVWSCCAEEVTEDGDAFTLHSTTGCSISPVHNWRMHAKAKGKVRENEYHNCHRYQ